MTPWYRIENPETVASPALLVYPDRIERNIRQMIELAGGAERLFPHVKTHKLPEIVRLQLAAGIRKFKCATIAEAEMVAECGAERVLLAYQPVGPNVERLLELIARFPRAKFAALVDNERTLAEIAAAGRRRGVEVELMVDLDVGMHRTGIAPGEEAGALYRKLASTAGVAAGGLHAYDGHIHDHDDVVRDARARAAFAPVVELRERLRAERLPVPRVIAGGTPTFPFHARAGDAECSPGTCLLMDASYAALMPGSGFEVAAVVATRVVSKPSGNRLCLDLGHKAIASENPHPRVHFAALAEAVAVGHSEEHLVLETARAGEFAVGDLVYGIPRHICPTVALHAKVTVVRHGRAEEQWRVVARDRMITV